MAGGGMAINFSWLPSLAQNIGAPSSGLPEEWITMNVFIQITPDNVIKILNPNPFIVIHSSGNPDDGAPMF